MRKSVNIKAKAFIINLPKEVADAKKANHYLEALGRIQIHISQISRKLLSMRYPEFKDFFKRIKDSQIFSLVHLAGFITKKEYEKLEKFRRKRNKFVHELTSINQYNSREVNKLISFGLELFEKLDKKLRT